MIKKVKKIRTKGLVIGESNSNILEVTDSKKKTLELWWVLATFAFISPFYHDISILKMILKKLLNIFFYSVQKLMDFF